MSTCNSRKNSPWLGVSPLWLFLKKGFFFYPREETWPQQQQHHNSNYKAVKLGVATILHCYLCFRSKTQIEFGDFVITSAKRQNNRISALLLISDQAPPAVTSREAGTPRTICQSNKHNSHFHSWIYGRFKPPINKAGAGARVAAFPPMISVLMFIEYLSVL